MILIAMRGSEVQPALFHIHILGNHLKIILENSVLQHTVVYTTD